MAFQTQEFKITGMTCGHCEMTVNKAIMKLGPGIINVVVSKDSGTASVTYDDSKVTPDQIRAAVNDTEIYSAA